LSDQLRWYARRSGLTVGQLAAATGLDKAVVSRFVRNKAGLSLPSVDAMAAALGLELRPRPGGKQAYERAG